MSFSQACDICLTKHFVRIENGVAICTCAGYCAKSECGHSVAAQHLEELIHVPTELQQIQLGRLPGRPRKYKPVEYAGLAPSPPPCKTVIQLESEAPKYYGILVARRFGDEDKVYVGRVSNSRLAPAWSGMVHCVR